MDLLGDEGLLRIGGKKTTDPKAAIEEERRRWREAPPTNAALDAWAKDLRPAKGGCHICQRDARGTCGSCERPVCSSHSWIMLGVCRECATEDRMASWNKERSTGKNWLDEA